MRTATFIASLLCAAMLVSCKREQPGAPPPAEKSVGQRVAELEQHLNGNGLQLSEAEARKQHEHDLAEIQSMGLVARAQRDFSNQFTNAISEKWTIRYLMDSNTVWCDVRYRLPGGSEGLQQEFGYTRKAGTNWSLIWRVAE